MADKTWIEDFKARVSAATVKTYAETMESLRAKMQVVQNELNEAESKKIAFLKAADTEGAIAQNRIISDKTDEMSALNQIMKELEYIPPMDKATYQGFQFERANHYAELRVDKANKLLSAFNNCMKLYQEIKALDDEEGDIDTWVGNMADAYENKFSASASTQSWKALFEVFELNANATKDRIQHVIELNQ